MRKIEQDKLLHFYVSVVLLLLLSFYIPVWMAASIVVGLGLTKEVYDWYYYDRWSWGDIAADIVGVISGFFFLLLNAPK